MAKPQYIDVVDHINKYQYDVVAPAHFMPISGYDKLFNFDPLYTPTSNDMPVRHSVTIDNMIEMHSNRIIFRLINGKEVFQVYEKLRGYIDMSLANPKRTTIQEAYLKKANNFLNECAKVCRINHTRFKIGEQHQKGTMSSLLSTVNKLWRT